MASTYLETMRERMADDTLPPQAREAARKAFFRALDMEDEDEQLPSIEFTFDDMVMLPFWLFGLICCLAGLGYLALR